MRCGPEFKVPKREYGSAVGAGSPKMIVSPFHSISYQVFAA
jgi:hypothetical protein